MVSFMYISLKKLIDCIMLLYIHLDLEILGKMPYVCPI